ncbi:MAG: transposase [Rhizobium sp.]|uniref:transposase n=1 Tax=Rhizobium sp. TaxID=391 RepID=UPI0030F04874
MKFRVANWREYEAGLRRRGSLTLWLTPEALSAWQAPRRKTRGGQHRYSDLAIETALALGLVSACGCARPKACWKRCCH